jgi:hypothetical protein
MRKVGADGFFVRVWVPCSAGLNQRAAPGPSTRWHSGTALFMPSQTHRLTSQPWAWLVQPGRPGVVRCMFCTLGGPGKRNIASEHRAMVIGEQ